MDKCDNLEKTRVALGQERTAAYGDALALARRLEAERDRLRGVLDSMIDSPCPTPLQWRLIGEKAKQLKATLGWEKKDEA